MNKSILLASFIFPERTDWFLNYLNNKFSIPKEKVFCYKNLDDESKIIMTFKLNIPEDKHINLKELFPNAVTIHKKEKTLYTINALNKLIEEKIGGEIGNVNYSSIKINWGEYQDKLIMINNKHLSIFNIKRIF